MMVVSYPRLIYTPFLVLRVSSIDKKGWLSSLETCVSDWNHLSSGAPIKEIYFLALIDVLTHYGVKKQAAKAAKSVKYGANVDGISTCDPEVYGKRFLEFLSKAIE